MGDVNGILVNIAPELSRKPKTKVSIVGVGKVGTAIAFSILTKQCAGILALVDSDENKCKGEVLDLQQGSQFLDACQVIGGKDFSYTAHSTVVFITAGVRQREGETEQDLIKRNVDLFKSIIPDIVNYSPHAIIVVVSKPVDILAQLTWKISGFSRNRVIGMGTLLDSARFRNALGNKLGLSANSIHGYLIGQSGDTNIAPWSKISVGGVNLCNVFPGFGQEQDDNNFAAVRADVITSTDEITRLKGYSSWAIGLCCADLCVALLKDRRVVMPLSNNINGMYGIDFDVFLSIPCVVNSNGVTSFVNLTLNDEEKAKLKASAESLKASFDNLKL